MDKTTYLQLAVVPPGGWSTKDVEEWVNELDGDADTSNMQIIDQAVGDIQNELTSLETAMASI